MVHLSKIAGTGIITGLLMAISVVMHAPSAHTEESAPTVAAIQAQMQAINDSGAHDAAMREQLTSIYNSALDQLRAANDWAAMVNRYEQIKETAPAEVARLREALQRPPDELTPDIPEDAGAAIIDGLFARAESELSGARAQRNALEKELFERGDRRRLLPELLAGARRRLDEMTVGALAEEADASAQAQHALVAARRAAVKKEIAGYEKELETYELRGQLLTLQLYKAGREVSLQENLVQAWRKKLRERRQQETIEAAEKAREALGEAEVARPHVRQHAERLAKENVEFVRKRTAPGGLVDKIEESDKKLREIESRHVALQANFHRLSQKVETVGLNNSIGLLLRRYREDLPDISQHRRDMRARQNEIASVQMEQMELQEKRLELADMERQIRGFLASEEMATPEQITHIEQIFRNLLQIQRDALDALLRDYDTYFEILVDLDGTQEAHGAMVQEFADYIDERVLWIRSSVTFGVTHLDLAQRIARQILAWNQLRQVPSVFAREFAAKPHFGALLLFAIGLSVWLVRRLGAEMNAISEKAFSSSTTSFKLTLDALAATILLSLPALAILWWVGHRLAGSSGSEPFARAVGEGMKQAAVVLVPLQFVRQSMHPGGLFRSHFGWMSSQVERIRRNAGWLMPVLGFSLFILVLLEHQHDEHARESLGRLVFIAMLATVAVFNHRLFHPQRGALRQMYDPPFQFGKRLRYGFYLLVMAMPFVLAGLVFTGYFYTVYRLSARLYETTALFFVLLLVRGIILRWLLLTKRALAIEQRRKKREALKAADEAGAREDATTALENEGLDLALVKVQTHRIVRSIIALAFVMLALVIWKGELPALGILNTIEVWPSLEVTLGDLMTGIVIAVLTFIATANLPGLLELTVLQRMNYLRGERYAITTIVRYAIAIVGFSVAFHHFGFGWSRIQWLVAALGVGLGFGLQEIFANFVSGIIILFERPIRVGDIVTVGGISGTVAKIHTRATWIVDFDRKELIVPNKEFITSQVINWTLTDSVLRITVKVGIAYGSDTALTERLLREAAAEHPDVLDDPEPIVLFKEFGESSLHFELRVYCGSADCMLDVIHGMHMAVDTKFRAAGIEIAFPRRDINIRSVEQLQHASGKPQQLEA